MKKVQTLALACALFAIGSVSWASIALNSSRSNIYRVVVEPGAVSAEQAKCILGKLDEFNGAQVEEVKVKGILKSCGVRADSMKEILYLPKAKGRELPTYIFLTDPKNKPAAIAVSEPGAPPDKSSN